MKSKKGNVLTENIIFVVLNLVFITILMIFLFSKAGAGPVLEEKYAKQIALAIDAATPVMQISIGMSDAIKMAQKNNYPLNQIVTIANNSNIVTVRLKSDSPGYSYSFFNNVDATPSITSTKDAYRITINKK